MKTCTKCGETNPVTEFSKHARMRDGMRSECKACARIYNAMWNKANQEKVKTYNAAWSIANPERKKAYGVARYAANPEKEKARKAKWVAENPEAARVQCQNKRARKRENGGKLSKRLSDKLFTLQRGKCACGCKQPLGANYHMDHIMPVALGGPNTDDNIQLLRATCNLQKHAKHPVDFMQSRGFLL